MGPREIKKKNFFGLQLTDYKGFVSDNWDWLSSANQFLFMGSMGSGKTSFIKELCNYLGVVEEVTSPTFSLVQEYLSKDDRLIYHFDLYRIKSLEEIQQIGFTEYLDSGKLCLIEWPEIAMPLIEIPYFEFHFKPSEIEDRRDIELIRYE